ncbi:MAG TPA: FUSC family protein, partial [Xanthobacteraceae bacterium]|nr:FUSC family protein [Xanthobacteraceae bacterium]
YPRDPDGSSGLMTICRAWLRQELIGKNADVLGSLDALRAGTYPLRQWRAPLYRSRRIAAESGVRAAIHFTLIAILFVMAGWPATEISLYFAAFIIALSSIAPDARMLTAVAIAAMPIACLLAGILKYFVFNGVSGFPLLAIGLAPVVIGSALLMTMPSRSWLGRLILIFTLTVFDAANPQNYDPRVYLVTSFCACLAAILSFAAHLLIPPLSNDRRLQLLLDETRRDLSNLDAQPHPHATPEEAAFHDATRIERIVTASGASLSYGQVVDEAMYCFDRAASLRQGYAELDRLATGPLAGAAYTARRALAQRDRSVILTAAEALRKAAAQHGLTADSACAALALASVAFAPGQSAPRSANREQP